MALSQGSMAIKSSGDTTKGAKRTPPLLPTLSVSIIQGLIRIYGRLQGELDKANDNRPALVEPAQSKYLLNQQSTVRKANKGRWVYSY
jgi:hypothetical protein